MRVQRPKSSRHTKSVQPLCDPIKKIPSKRNRAYNSANRQIGILPAKCLHRVECGQSITQAAMAKHVAACFATPVRIDSMPRQIPITHRQFDITAIRQAFPDFAFTPLDEGLARAVRR